ncbi:hypothetical protein ACEPAI_4364 [Sanghuangporus weigelae]
MSETTGFIDFVYNNETFRAFFRLVGELKPGSRPPVLLHGGPATPNPYLDLLTYIELQASYGVPLIFYDQIGGRKIYTSSRKTIRLLDIRTFHGRA